MKAITVLEDKLKDALQNPNRFLYWPAYYDIFYPHNCNVALAKEHNHKNFFNFAYPFDHNLITSIPFYINASPMRFGNHYYIATQGPRRSTHNDFWQLIWAEKATLVVSVTNEWEEEKEKKIPKFEAFWKEKCYDTIEVQIQEDKLLKSWHDGRDEKIRLRHLTVKKDRESREVAHLHMENWPDGSVVRPDSLVALSEQTDLLKKEGSIVVHCAAGIGRTGTFIAFHSLFHDMIAYLNQPEISTEFDITERIAAMRNLRYGSMIADKRQYFLLIQALELALKKMAS